MYNIHNIHLLKHHTELHKARKDVPRKYSMMTAFCITEMFRKADSDASQEKMQKNISF